MEPALKRIRFDDYSLDNVCLFKRRLRSYNYVKSVINFLFIYCKIGDDIRYEILQFLIGGDATQVFSRSVFDIICSFTPCCFWTLTPVIKLHLFFLVEKIGYIFNDLEYFNACLIEHKEKFVPVFKQIRLLGKREYWWGFISNCFMENNKNYFVCMENLGYLRSRLHGQFIAFVKNLILFRHGFPLSLMLYCVNKRSSDVNYFGRLSFSEELVIGVACFHCSSANCFCSYQIKSNDEVFVCTNVSSSDRASSIYEELKGDLILNVYSTYYIEMFSCKHGHDIYTIM